MLTSPLSEGFLAYQEESKVSLEELGAAMARATETHGEHPLYVLERGEISEREFADRLERELPGGFSLTRLREVYFERLVPNAPMIAFARELRERGLRTALLTNNVREWEPLWRAKLPELDEIFEVVVDSAFVGLRKPDPRIYELTLERLGHGGRPSACSSTTSTSTARRPGRSGCTRCASRRRVARSRRSRRRCRGPELGPAERARPCVVRIAASGVLEVQAAGGSGSSPRPARPRRPPSPPSPWRAIQSGSSDSSWAKTFSTSRAFARLAAFSQPAIVSDSCSRSSAARRTPVTRSRRLARWATNASRRSSSGRVDVDRPQGRHDPLVLAHCGRREERLAVAEVLEDRALRHTGALGHALRRGAQLALLEQLHAGP